MKDPMERSVTPEVLSEASKCKMFDLRTETLHIAAPNFFFFSQNEVIYWDTRIGHA